MMMHRRIQWLGVLLVALPVLAPTLAAAANKESLERTAKKSCMTGDPTKGVEILADLFIDTGDLTHVFNQGRCWEQNSRYEAAIARFREYLIKGTNLSSEAKAEAERHIAICQSLLGKNEPAAAPAVPTAAPLAPPAPAPAPAPAPISPPIEQHPLPPTTSAGSGLRLGGVVTAAVGVAALAAGVALNLKANSMASDLEKPYNYSRSSESSRKDYQTMGWVSYGAGAACIVTGAILYTIGWHRGRAALPAVAVSPVWAPQGGSLALTGAF